MGQKNNFVFIVFNLTRRVLVLVQIKLEIFIFLPVIIQLLSSSPDRPVQSIYFPRQTIFSIFQLPTFVLVLFVCIQLALQLGKSQLQFLMALYLFVEPFLQRRLVLLYQGKLPDRTLQLRTSLFPSLYLPLS